MSSNKNTEEKQRSQQLNPFVFPSETRIRFILLVIAVVALTFNLGLILADQINLLSIGDLQNKVIEVGDPPPFGTSEQPDGWQEYKIFLEKNIDLLGDIALLLLLPTGLTVLTLALATVIYRAHPVRVRRRHKLKPLTDERMPTLLTTVQHLAKEVKIKPPPVVEIGNDNHLLAGQLFGLPNRYSLRLGGQSQLALENTPHILKAIILHELAHIVNKDNGLAYFSHALWVALVFLVMGPIALWISGTFVLDNLLVLLQIGINNFDWSYLATHNLSRLLFIYLRIGVTLAVVAAIRSSLLRVRELYADWRAVLWGARDSLFAILQTQENSRGKPCAIWRLHPMPVERIAALERPTKLFHLSSEVVFFVGFLLTAMLSSLIFVIQITGIGLLTGIQILIYSVLASPAENVLVITMVWWTAALALPSFAIIILFILLGAGYMVAQTIGLEMQREALFRLSENHKNSCWRLLLLAGVMALGMQAALIFTPYSPLISIGVEQLLMLPLWLIGTTGLFWLWLSQVQYFAQQILGYHFGIMGST